jgi:D-alanine-D-alanine ligase
VLPPWELHFDNLRADAPRIATRRAKWDSQFAADRGLRLRAAADLDPATAQKIARVSRRIYRALELSGYARIDFRLREDGELFFIEANPNPDLARDAEMALAARAAGLTYDALIDRILALGEKALDR